MKQKAAQAVGGIVNQAKFTTEAQENFSWKIFFLGNENGFGFFGIQFALRAGQEHRNLRFKNSQLSLEHDESGCEFLQYVEDFSKINNGGLYHLRVKRKVVRVYKKLTDAERFPVELHK